MDESPLHPKTINVMAVLMFFEDYELDPAKVKEVNKPFKKLAKQLLDRAPEQPETVIALRKLLEAKEAAIRAYAAAVLLENAPKEWSGSTAGS